MKLRKCGTECHFCGGPHKESEGVCRPLEGWTSTRTSDSSDGHGGWERRGGGENDDKV